MNASTGCDSVIPTYPSQPGEVGYDAQVRWFRSLTPQERMDYLCKWVDIALKADPEIANRKNDEARPISRKYRVLDPRDVKLGVVMSRASQEIPPYQSFFNPVLKVLKALGGSGSIEEIDSKVCELQSLPRSVMEVLHNPETGTSTEVEYRLAWARTYLKAYGLIDNSKRGVWTLTRKAETVEAVNETEVIKFVRTQSKQRREGQTTTSPNGSSPADDLPEEIPSWRSSLYRLLTNELEPAAFERLAQRLLRECGFTQVEVTGRSGDGGIDGKGIAKIHGLMSFHVVFQCKRYKGVVGAEEIRSFRGASVGRSDRGLFITTGSFTREAIKEANRDGAPPIDLLDGEALADKLKDLQLGVKVELVEQVTIDPEWFKSI